MLEHPEWLAIPEEIREKILEKRRDWNVDGIDWWDCTEEDLISDMSDIGIRVNRMYFSGFWSQGDGACFEGYVHNWPDFLVACKCEHLVEIWETLNESSSMCLSCSHDRGRYYHELNVDFSDDLTPDNPYDEEDDPLRWAAFDVLARTFGQEYDTFVEFFRDQMRALYRRLEEEYDYLTSDEAIVESLLINDRLDELRQEFEDETDELFA